MTLLRTSSKFWVLLSRNRQNNMSLIKKSVVEAVHNLNIMDVLNPYNLGLKRSGANYVCCCPFHSERTPSFSVSPAKNICKCFSCGEGGDPVQFVMKIDGLSYREAVEKLAQDHGIPLEYEKDERTDEELAAEKERESMKVALQASQTFMVEQFYADTPEAAAARAYATGRWNADFCKNAGIGYAPKDSAVFLEYMKRKGFSLEPLLALGLIGKNEQTGQFYTMLRQRVTLPVRNRSKSMVTFSARYIGDNAETMKRSKYMNLKESPLFNKSDTLFGIDIAAKAAYNCGHFVLVEGGPDVFRLQIIGVEQAVAPMGTVLTLSHLKQMQRICKSIIFIPDSDAPKDGLYGAGVNAVMKNGKLAMENGFDVKVKEIPRTDEDDANGVKYDADSYITSIEIYHSLEPVPFVLWYTQKRLQGATTSELQSEVISEVAALLLNVTDENLREMYIDQLCKLVGKKKMWTDAVKRAGRQVRQAANEQIECEGLDPKILASLRSNGFILKGGCYYAPDDDSNLVRCSNFTFTPVLHIKSSVRSTRIYHLHNNRGDSDVVEFVPGDLVTTRDFNKRLIDRGNYLWRGDAKTFTAIQEHLLEVTPTASHIEILGWNPKEEFFAFSNGIYAKGRFNPTDSLGVVSVGHKSYYLPAFSEINKDNELGYSFERTYRCNPQGATTLHDFVAQIVKVYGTGGMVSIAWTLATIFRDIIFARFKYFPVLNLFGRKGSGKTELARAISSLFYTLPSTPCSCANTSIPVIGYNLSHARNSVFILDEFTNDLMPQRIDIMKGLWGGTARSKMEDGIPITIPVTSGVILAGQYKPEDEAIFSRCIHLMYSQTSFTREEKRNFKALSEMVLHGNTHLLLLILELRDIFEKNFFQTFDVTLNDVLSKLENDRVEDRILNNWVVALAAFRVLEPHLEMPFTYAELFDVVVNGIRYQNDQIRKSSDTANFWLYLDSMHTQGKVKEKCHFVIKRLTSFSAIKKEKTVFVEPKRIIFLNFKAVRGLLEQRIARQKTGSTLDTATLESYLKSLPQFLGIKQQRFQILRTNGELDEEYKSEGVGSPSKKYVNSNPSNALCFDYDSLKSMLDLNLETFRMTEDEMNADDNDNDNDNNDSPLSDNTIQEPELPF